MPSSRWRCVSNVGAAGIEAALLRTWAGLWNMDMDNRSRGVRRRRRRRDRSFFFFRFLRICCGLAFSLGILFTHSLTHSYIHLATYLSGDASACLCVCVSVTTARACCCCCNAACCCCCDLIYETSKMN